MREHDALALVLHEPFQDREPITEAQIQLMEKVASAAPEADIGGCMFTPRAVSPDVSELGILIYRS